MTIHLGFSTELAGFANSARKPPPALANHTLMKEFQSSGQFWLPGSDTRALWGRLHYIPGGTTSLTLDGNLVPNRHYPINLDIPELYGRLYNGAPCVLKSLWGGIESFIAKEELFRTRLHSRLFIFGLDPQASAADRFCASAITLSHLNDWFDRPLELDYQERKFDDCLVRFRPDKEECRSEFRGCPFKLDVFCARTIPSLPDSERLEFTYRYKLTLLPDNPQPLDWHLALASILREFFMFVVGTGIYTLEVEAFAGTKPGDDAVHVFPRVTVPMLVRLDPYYFYCRHADIRDQFPDLLTAWLRHSDTLTVVRHTISDLLTVDGTSPEAVFTRVVQTMEHFHGLVFSDESRYVSRSTWRGFTDWLDEHFGEVWPEATPEQREALNKAKLPLVGRIRGINSLSFRSRIRALFEAVPPSELMPIIDNPRDNNSFLDEFIPRVEATRHYLTHFSAHQRSLAFPRDQLKTATLQCWSVLVFSLARFLGLGDDKAGDLALAARETLFLVGTDAKL